MVKEGDYESWAYLWTLSIPNGSNWGVAKWIDEVNDVLHIIYAEAYTPPNYWQRYRIYKMSDCSLIFASPSGQHYHQDSMYFVRYGWFQMTGDTGYYATRSENGKYVAFPRADAYHIEVWKSGKTSVLWSRDCRDDYPGFDFDNIQMSQSGKYILVGPSEYGDMICYKGVEG